MGIAIDLAAPGTSVLITVDNALSDDIDAFAIGAGSAYAFDTAGTGVLFTNPGVVPSLGQIDQATGDFLLLRSVVNAADGTPISSAAAAMAVDNAGSIFVITADGELLQFSDTNGEFVGITGLVGQFETALEGMTDEERAAALGAIFTGGAVKSFSILLGVGSEELATYQEELTGTTTAFDQQAAMLDTLPPST